MARGDGKARKGFTRAKTPRSDGVKRMSLGGFMGGQPESARSSSGLGGSTREGGFAGAGSRPGGSSGGGGLAGSTRDGGMRPGGSGQMGGGGEGPRGLAGSTRDGGFAGAGASRPSGGSAAGQVARLGSDPARAMTQAGIDSGRAQMLAGLYNDLSQPRLKDPSIRGTAIESLTPGGKIADRIQPTEGYIPQPTFMRQPARQQPQQPTGFRSGYLDQQSIVPGSVSFTQANKQVPFAETTTGKNLLARSQSPLTAAEAKALAGQLPPGTQLIGGGLAALRYPTPSGFNPAQYNSYPTTIDGYNFSVNVPKSATVNTPYGPKIGQWNPAASPPAAPKAIVDRIPPGGVKQFYDRLPQDAPAAPKAAPAGVVASPRQNNFSALDRPFPGRDGGDRDDRPPRGRKKKRPIIEETTTAKNGGLMTRGDGKASRGKTKGRYI